MKENNIDLIKKLLLEITVNKNNIETLSQHIVKIENDLDKKSKYYGMAKGFIYDIKLDIKSWNDINIDSTNNDEYIDNYFTTKLETQKYNKLILESNYKKIFEITYSNKVNIKEIIELYIEIEENYIKYSKKINTSIIAKNLLIFSSFNKKNPNQALNRLWELFISLWLKELVKRVNKLTEINNSINYKIKEKAKSFLKEETYNYKYISFKKNGIWYSISDKIIDTSKHMYRTWNPKYEYKKIINNI